MSDVGNIYRKWERYAVALDLHLAGWPMYAIGDYFGVSRQRAHQMVDIARQQLAFRIFKGIKRPSFYRSWWETELRKDAA